MFRYSVLSAIFALTSATTPALAAPIGAAPPSAFSGLRSTPTIGVDLGDQGGVGLIKRPPGQQTAAGPSLSTGLSTALSVGGSEAPTLAATSIPTGGRINRDSLGPIVQHGGAPSVQAAIGAAVSIGGSATAGASNANSGEGGAVR